MTPRLHDPGPPHVEATRLHLLLRDLDEVEHLERPAGFEAAAAHARFAQLTAALDTAFAHPCDVDT